MITDEMIANLVERLPALGGYEIEDLRRWLIACILEPLEYTPSANTHPQGDEPCE